MRLKHSLALAALTAVLGGASAQAAPAYSVTATFDPLITGNTSFTITNLSASPETNVTVSSGATSHLLGNLGAGAKTTYSFNDVAGPFLVEPGPAGVLDTTTYFVSATLLGQPLSSPGFSPVKNATGGYVDFLGACWNNSVGCSVDPTGTYPLSATVATVNTAVTAVPAPPSLLLLGTGLVGLAAIRRKAVHGFNTGI